MTTAIAARYPSSWMLHPPGISTWRQPGHPRVEPAPGRPGRRRGARVLLRCYANSDPVNIAKAPTWGDTLKGAFFWGNPKNWDSVPRSWYWTMIFAFLKVVGVTGGYRGRANFGKRESGLEPLLRLREAASQAVDATASEHVDRFPDLARHIASDGTGTGLAVVVPAYARGLNDVDELRATLEALAKQTMAPEAVLIVDDASPVDLSPALADWPHAGKLAHVRMKQNTGPAGARSVGLRLLRSWAAGRRLVICLTDSDAVPHGRWCEALFEAQSLFPGIFCGPTLSLVDSHIGRFHDHFGNLNGRWRWQDQPAVLLYGCTCNFSVDTSAVKLQEFDPIFSRAGFEDIEFCWRARKSLGVLTRYCEGAHVYHEYDRGLSGLYKQFWKYGNTEPIMAWMHPDFSFQGSKSLVTGFRDPRLQVLAASMPQGPNAEAAKAIFERIMRLFKQVQPV